MTVPFPLDAFDHAHPVKTPRPPMDRAKLVSVALTIAFHVVILGGALTAVQVSRSRPMQELKVSIALEKPKPVEAAPPPPKMVQPTVISMPPPEVVIQTAPPPAPVQATIARPVTAPPPPTAPASTGVTGEGRDAFLGRLLAQLNRFKQYPRTARAAHIEGVVMLHFVMDADGKVTSYEIAKSSGRPVLDQEALALIQRAQPLPALPAGYPTRTLDAVVPIEFSLNA